VSRQQSRYLIVGGSAAGMAAAHAIRAKDPRGTVTVFTAEDDAPYFRPLIPFLVSGKKQAADMALPGCGPYREKDIDVRTGSKVAALEPDRHVVMLEDGTRHGYEKILFATGSRPYVPPEIQGTDSEGVFALRTLADARRMAERVDRTDHAVMLGGGLLNLKAAFALLERGVKVTLAVYSPEVLSQLMEPEDAILIRKALVDAGLEIMTGVAATKIKAGSSGVTGIVLNDGNALDCQMVCIGKGVRPNVGFLESSGIQLEKGIVADRYTGASLPDTFAAGDVAVTHEPVSGEPVMTALWTNAVEMGRCAGLNMAGRKTAYTGTFGILNATQVADLPFVSMGVVHTEGGEYEIHRKTTETTFRKFVFDSAGKRLVGAVLVGDITHAGLYRYVIQGKMDTAAYKKQIINHSLHYGHLLRS
jgi:nitrite reductase (NADH) large subunit